MQGSGSLWQLLTPQRVRQLSLCYLTGMGWAALLALPQASNLTDMFLLLRKRKPSLKDL